MTKHILLILVIASLLAACSPAQTPAPTPAATATIAATTAAPMTPADGDTSVTPEPGALPDDVVAKLDEFLQAQVYSEGADPKSHAPGLVLLVDTPDGRYLQAAGVASLEDGTPMQVDDRLEIGSNSKSFIIVLLLQLQEEGVLSIDDPLSKWLPDWAEKIPNGDQMTLRQLAQHTSGIWDYGDPILGEAANDPVKLEQGYTPDELVQYAVDNGTPDFAPGEQGMWKYSNTGYILLGMVIEKAAGQPLGELLKARIFEPLGLQTAALIEGVPEPGEITNGYWWTEDGKINNTTSWNASQGWAAGAIAMTAEELLTYGKALAAGKLFQNPDTLAEMLIFDPKAEDGFMPYGLGLMDFSKLQAPGSWGHGGQTAGFQSLWYTNPETGVTVVGLTNSATYEALSFLQIAGLLNSNALDTTKAPEDAKIPDHGMLTAHPWQWAGFAGATEQFTVETPASYQVTFNDDGTVNIVADCNNAAGTYTEEMASSPKMPSLDGALTITIGPMTMAACPPESRSEQFVTLLAGAARYFFVDDTLFIDLMADGGVMRLDPAGATADADAAAAEAAALMAARVAGMMGTPWSWTTLTTGTDQVTVEMPASYMVTFNEDGTVAIKADCNDASGTYTLDGADVTIELGAATLAACPGDSRSEQFLQLLGDAAQLLPLGAQLVITMKTESNAMILVAAPTTVVDLCGEDALAINTIDDTLAPEIRAQLDQGLVSLVQAAPRPGPGASMLIITPEGRYFKSTGVADVTTCEPLAADSPFQIGSNTKMMTSAILFQLQEEGVLSTSDLLSKWLPDLAAQLPNGDQITIDMMMTHTSGLTDYFDVPIGDGSIADGATDKAMLTRAFTPEELVKLVADSGLSEFEPGAEGKWKYSNTGYILLGLIIEEATGKSYEDNLKERIFEPLGLEQTHLQIGQPEAGALPQAYFHSPFDFTTSEWNASQGWSAGAVVSTPDEFATFLKALFTGKLFQDPATLDLMKQHTEAGVDALGPGTVYAHGMLDNNGVLGHGGQTLGFQSDGGYIPDQDVTFVMWSNAAESNVSRMLVPAIANIVK